MAGTLAAAVEIRIEIPDELAATLRRTPEELQYDLRLRALAGLVERGLLSTGRAADLAGVSRREFLDWCGRWHIRVHRWDAAEVDVELSFAEAGKSA
jgi:predicted HTH domain antitoxin